MNKDTSTKKGIRKMLEIEAAMGNVPNLEDALNSIGPIQDSQSLREKCYGKKLDALEYEILDSTKFAIATKLWLPTSAVEKYEEAVKLAETARNHGVDLGFNYHSYSEYLTHKRSFFLKNIGDSDSTDTNQIELSAIEELKKLEEKTYAELAKYQISSIAIAQDENGIVDQETWEKLYEYNKKAGAYNLDLGSIMKKVQEALNRYPKENRFLAHHGLDLFFERIETLEKKVQENGILYSTSEEKFLDSEYPK